MGRILFFLGLFLVIGIAWAVSRRRNSLSNEERVELEALRREREERIQKTERLGEPMEKCAYCGVYFPKREAVYRGGKVYCSAKCRDADAKRSG